VQDLLKKIEAAAEARLAFSPDATAAEKLARYKHFLKVESHRLKLLHRAGADGREICQALRLVYPAAHSCLLLPGSGEREFTPATMPLRDLARSLLAADDAVTLLLPPRV